MYGTFQTLFIMTPRSRARALVYLANSQTRKLAKFEHFYSTSEGVRWRVGEGFPICTRSAQN